MKSLARSFLLLSLGAVAGVAFVVSCHAGPGRVAADPPPSSLDAAAGACPSKVITADTDGEQIQSGKVTIGVKPTTCKGLYSSLPCEKVLDGPFFLTDLETDCPGVTSTAFAIVGDPENPRARMNAFATAATSNAIHGARLYVKAGESLSIGWTSERTGDSLCSLHWTGFKPY